MGETPSRKIFARLVSARASSASSSAAAAAAAAASRRARASSASSASRPARRLPHFTGKGGASPLPWREKFFFEKDKMFYSTCWVLILGKPSRLSKCFTESTGFLGKPSRLSKNERPSVAPDKAQSKIYTMNGAGNGGSGGGAGSGGGPCPKFLSELLYNVAVVAQRVMRRDGTPRHSSSEFARVWLPEPLGELNSLAFGCLSRTPRVVRPCRRMTSKSAQRWRAGSCVSSSSSARLVCH